jgi:archaellum biogenesis ATPase FlaH
MSRNKGIDYESPTGFELVGDKHICMGGQITIIAGPVSVGKSKIAFNLADSGANGRDWLGYKTHRRFKTMIIQSENNQLRIKEDYLDTSERVEDFIRVSKPPPFGIRLDDDRFREDLKEALDSFKPDLVIFDPWTAMIKDITPKEILETFKGIRELIPPIDASPAIVIIMHIRKLNKDDRRLRDRALIDLVLGSVANVAGPRSVFVVQFASDDLDDDRIVLSCVKNNDGRTGLPSMWQRSRGINFVRVADFDFKEYEKKKSGTDKKKFKATILLRFLVGQRLGYNQWYKATGLDPAITMSRDTFDRLVKELLEEGFVKCENDGYRNLYWLTEKGKRIA